MTNRPLINSANSTGGNATWHSFTSIRSIGNRLRRSFPHGCLDWFLQIQAEGEKWQWHDYPVNQLFGVQNQFPSFMANTHRLLSEKDCNYYVMRLDALPKKFDQVLDGLKIREQKQILPPRFVVEEVLKEMTDFIGKPASENILATSFKTRAAKIDKLSEARARRFSSARGIGNNQQSLSGLSKTDRLFP